MSVCEVGSYGVGGSSYLECSMSGARSRDLGWIMLGVLVSVGDKWDDSVYLKVVHDFGIYRSSIKK